MERTEISEAPTEKEAKAIKKNADGEGNIKHSPFSKLIENAPKKSSDLVARDSLYKVPKEAHQPLKINHRYYKAGEDDILYTAAKAIPVPEKDLGMWEPLIPKARSDYEKSRWQSTESIPSYNSSIGYGVKETHMYSKAEDLMKDENKRFKFQVLPKSSFKLTDGMASMYDNSSLYRGIAREEHLSEAHQNKLAMSREVSPPSAASSEVIVGLGETISRYLVENEIVAVSSKEYGAAGGRVVYHSIATSKRDWSVAMPIRLTPEGKRVVSMSLLRKVDRRNLKVYLLNEGDIEMIEAEMEAILAPKVAKGKEKAAAAPKEKTEEEPTEGEGVSAAAAAAEAAGAAAAAAGAEPV